MIVCKARGEIGTQVMIEGNLDDLMNEVSAALYGVIDGVAKKVGEKEAVKAYWEIMAGVGGRLANNGIKIASDEIEDIIDSAFDDEDEDEDDGVVIPPDIFKNFMNGGDLLF